MLWPYAVDASQATELTCGVCCRAQAVRAAPHTQQQHSAHTVLLADLEARQRLMVWLKGGCLCSIQSDETGRYRARLQTGQKIADLNEF